MYVKYFFWGILLSFAVTCCGKKEVQSLRIGVIIPLTGEAAEFGKDQQMGMIIASQRLQHNIREIGYDTLEIVYEDCRSKSTDAISGLQRLLTKEVIAISTTLSSVSMAMLPIIEEKKVPMITIAAHPNLTDGNKYVIRLLPTATEYAERLANLLSTELNLPRIGILYVNDDFGNGIKDSFIKKYQSLNGIITNFEPIDPSESNFRTEIVKTLSVNPNTVFVIGYGNTLGTLVKQLRELGFKGQIIGTPELSYPDVAAVAGSALNNAIVVTMWIDSSKIDVKNFSDQYEKDYNKKPSLDSYLGFDAINLIAQGVVNQNKSGRDLRTELFSLSNFPGLTGSLTVKENGDVEFPLVLRRLVNGNQIPL